jgi:hypothetical protein
MLREEVSLCLDWVAGNARILIIRHPEKPGESWPVKRIVGGHWGLVPPVPLKPSPSCAGILMP